MRRVAMVMGTAASIDIPGVRSPKVFEQAFRRLRQIDKQFSPYKNNSELCRYQRGELPANQLSGDFKHIHKECDKLELICNGYFSANFGSNYDPTGYVKGWAIGQAAEVIKQAGYGTFAVGVGGDILACCDSAKIWNLAVQHPLDRSKIVKVIPIKNGALATSGNYERGCHIINPKTNQAADFWLSTTIVGPDITMADVLATACFAMGPLATKFIKSFPDYDLLAIAREEVGNDLAVRQAQRS